MTSQVLIERRTSARNKMEPKQGKAFMEIEISANEKLVREIIEVSQHGLSFKNSKNEVYFLPGTPLKKITIFENGEKIRSLSAIVKHISQTLNDNGSYKIGVQFNDPKQNTETGVTFKLTDEQKALQDTVRRFTQKEIIPSAAYYDQTGEFPWPIMKKAFEIGIFTSYIPEEYGGAGMGIFETALITEELASGCMAMGTSIMVNLLGISPLLIAGSEEQKQRYLKLYCQELTLFSFCFTEPDAGSDPSRIGTRAELIDNHYVLNGSKCFITNGGVANYYIVFATLDKSLGTKGLTAFLTPSNVDGIKVGKNLDKMGQRASNTAEIFFENVKIPLENRIGEEGEGYKIALHSISRSRINVAAGAVGIARSSMEHALKYVQSRVQFNQPLADFQYVRFRLSDMATHIDAARLLTWRASWTHDHGQKFAMEASMAKDFAGDMVMKVTSEALDLLGGYGYSKEYPMEKLMRDAKLMQIYEGPSPIHKTIIYRELAKKYGF